tara:strand:+ start:48 stop:722 length:675 start_codon:yes stop_codon:yes gene_type:complete
MKKILCIVAHPDDEVLGIGGTLIKHVAYGDSVDIIILSEGETSKSVKIERNSRRLSNAKSCSDIIGSNLYKIFNFPDQQLDKISQLKIVKKLENCLEKLKPDIIYTHHPADINSDHQITAHTTLVAARPISYHKVMPEIRCFETPSSTEQAPNVEPYVFKPNFYVCIEKVWKKKIEAINAYSKEIKKYPHPRSIKSIESLAIKRGSEVNLKKAEAFYIIRKVWK